MSITMLYSMTVAVPDDCPLQQFGHPACPDHRRAMDAVAWRCADAAAAAIVAAVRAWLDQRGLGGVVVATLRNGDTDDTFGLIVESEDGDADSLADGIRGVIWDAHGRWWGQARVGCRCRLGVCGLRTRPRLLPLLGPRRHCVVRRSGRCGVPVRGPH